MAESTSLPDARSIASAERFTRERFVHDGEEPADALAPGSARRRALDAALAEIAGGAKVPSVAWRREYSLLVGLERLLSEEEAHLADGTLLNPHQVDALSGTLTALMAEVQRTGNGSNGTPQPVEEPAELASSAIPGEEDIDLDEGEPDEEPQDWQDDQGEEDDNVQLAEQPEDPNAARRFWFEHATGAGKTVAALGFVEASRTGGVLILTHRRNLVDQFHGELRERGYADRISAPLLAGQDSPRGPVTVETYQWFVRNAGRISDAYTIVICDEAHTALGEKTSGSIRQWAGPVFVGMTATGALIARHVTDLFPTQTSRFDLAQAARRGVISPLRCIRIPPGPGVRTIAKVPLRRGEVDTEFDQEMLAELLDQLPFNLAIADLYKTRFNGVPGVVYTAGVRHAYNVAQAFRDVGMKAQAVSGETPKRELARILADYERGKIDVLINAQLLAEGWNSPRATVCMHLAPTASKRIYQQRVGRVTRRHQGKEAGIVVDFVHPATKNDESVITLHSLLDRDVYRGGAIVVGPVRRGRGRRVRVERRVLPVTPDPERRAEVFERELWRIAVDHLDYGEQHVWAALAGARVAPNGWRRAKAMLHFDRQGDLKRRFLITAVERNRNAQLRLRALQEIAAARDAEAFDQAIDLMGTWPRDERREGVKIMLQALAEKRIGRRDQANAWIWRMAEYTREVHEEYAVQRWPETKRLLGLLVNSSGGAHARNARRLVHASRRQDRRLSAALLAAALAHTPEAEEALRGARTRMARKPSALARELLRNFPRGRRSRGARRRRKGANQGAAPEEALAATAVATDALDHDGDGAGGPESDVLDEALADGREAAVVGSGDGDQQRSRRGSRRRRGSRGRRGGGAPDGGPRRDGERTAEADAPESAAPAAPASEAGAEAPAPEAPVSPAESGMPEAAGTAAASDAAPAPRARRARRTARRAGGADVELAAVSARGTGDAEAARAPRARRARARRGAAATEQLELVPTVVEELQRRPRARRSSTAPGILDAVTAAAEAVRVAANGTDPRPRRAAARRAPATRTAAAARAARAPRARAAARRAPARRAAARAAVARVGIERVARAPRARAAARRAAPVRRAPVAGAARRAPARSAAARRAPARRAAARATARRAPASRAAARAAARRAPARRAARARRAVAAATADE
ncbi:DEAD/DEAH box helicase family protein [Conexibacter stalactiti]|uniref:DEAD/DEAH box helicase family protein n=1 Tax=Conexibacter stalactiti TaxID=1940611 RepID=A0ABU4HJ25_9ACTN|nr:DEAD/DEAH box helicase family protein [Conexibacter stalactiti]MDW5593323.1 DEAD/DEAH box helicase family protein [Conexibacter stalactiti]MEC5033964.1 DEAD/DEAH box helicase family protein [Conexibacter stalactiti]